MRTRYLWSFALGALLFCIVSFATDLVPVVGETTPTLADILRSLFDLTTNWKALPLWGAVLAALKILVDVTKQPFMGSIFDKIGPAGKRLIPILLSTLTVGAGAFASGATWPTAIALVFGSSGGAMLLHELIQAFTGKASA